MGTEERSPKDSGALPELPPKLSVLVPIYNAEPFLRQCLDSLLGQTMGDLEVLCINDGSTDGSAAILDEYAAKDGRIRIITKENSGYGDSMNRGLSEARGDWIGICEPDDFCDRRMFAKLVQAAERFGCDLAKANYTEYEGGRGRRMGLYDPFRYGKPFSPWGQPQVLLTAPTIWAAVYRRSMVRDYGIAFSETPGASYQDASFGHQCWVAAQRVVLLKPGFYRYRVDNQASSSKSSDKVFAVNGEYERSFAFLEKLGPEYLRHFGPWLNVMRSGVYVWNYNRIAPQHHLPFAEAWAREVVEADDAGLLRLDFFTPQYRRLLCRLLDDPVAFCEDHRDGIPVPPIM